MFKTATPTRVSTDNVTPLHFFDDTPLWRAFVLYSMFVFDDTLDPRKLRESLEALAQKDGWRKLSARLRQNVRQFNQAARTSFKKDFSDLRNWTG